MASTFARPLRRDVDAWTIAAGDGVRRHRHTASNPTTILGASAVDVSYPGFFEALGQLHAVTLDKIFLVGHGRG